MKRSRDIEKRSEINSAIEELSVLVIVKPEEDHEAGARIPTKPFLSLCYMVLQVLDKVGPTMAVLRQDIHQNIKRLEAIHESNPLTNSNLVEIFKSETSKGNGKKRVSGSKSFVWLTRSLDFTSALLQALLVKDPKKNMEQAVQESYDATLKPWHGWIASAAYRVAIKLVPDTKTFMDLLREKDEDCNTLMEKMEILVSLLVPFLEDIHCILKVYNLDRLKSN
ncbi:putative glycolipid transfer protein [Medicago truncatula]|uniref:Glycolipid transfer protein (GLTP) family protein n=1 Tax=Medicago truncatula TaxID=3880 RepID=G7J670_MEDTR|nr:glycolipid transfer protein 3 [Medicago truncatula]AES72414.1 glycolipid transfer protein (GLTP) family protein [Medicago truncatula]AFK40381.1 unknown [Medicago truncatula]RHN69569.1 putative glycolipid transfer protein [Medicago truncatula]